MARALVDGGVEKVTLSGGEPMLAAGVEDVVKILGKNNVYVSLHTNGYFLNDENLARMKDYLGDVYLPVDSMKRKVNDSTRGTGSLEVFKKGFDLLSRGGVKAGVHTVVTPKNIGGLGKILKYISAKDFFKWKAYEVFRGQREGEIFSHDGGVYDFAGDFLLAEDRIKKGNEDIEFVLDWDRAPYLFLNGDGDIRYTPWFFEGGKLFGNILEDGLEKIAGDVDSFVGSDAAEFFEGVSNLPLWARAVEGANDPEEFGIIDVEHADRFNLLVDLYEKHLG